MAIPTIAQQVLEAWGATARLLPTSSKEESDWLAELDGCRLLIEEKTKFSNPDLVLERRFSLKSTGSYTKVIPVSQSNRLSGIVHKAVRQLSSSGSSFDHDLRIIWLTSVGWEAEAKRMQFEATLYGSTKVFEIDGNKLIPCYFFYNSEFYRYGNEIDGAIAAFLHGNAVTMYLCLNPYSDKWQILRDSPFAKHLQQGLIDPIAEESSGLAFIVDTDIDRKNREAVLRYLQSKYNTGKLANMDFKMASAEIVVPKRSP